MDDFSTQHNNDSEQNFDTGYDIDTSKKSRLASTASLEKEFGALPNINDPSQQTHDGVFSKRIKLRFIADFVESISKIPTFFPKNFYQQFKLWFLPDKNRLYIYDYINRRWVWVQGNIDEYETTQLTLPSEFSADTLNYTAAGWYSYYSFDIPNPASNSSAVPFANGGTFYSNSGSGFSYTNLMLSSQSLLDWDTTKKLRFEAAALPLSTTSGVKSAFGFIDLNGGPLKPENATDRSLIDRRIAFMIEGSDLYAACADGTAITSVLITGVTLTTLQLLRFKFLWQPVEGSVQFFVNDELKATISTNVPNTPAAPGDMRVFIGGVGPAGDNGIGMTFPKVGLQIN